MATKFNNPIAYGVSYAAQNVDALNRVGVSSTPVFNGSLVTLGKMNAGASKDMGYVFEATLTASKDAKNVWMVRTPEVPKDICGNLYDDPRAFSIAAGETFDMIHLEPGDIIKLSATEFNTKPVAASKEWVVPYTAGGKYEAKSSASSDTGLVLKLVGREDFVVGHEMVEGYLLEVVANPTTALA